MSTKTKAEVITIGVCATVLALIVLLVASPVGFIVFLVFLILGGLIVFVVLNLVMYDMVLAYVLHKLELKDIRDGR